LSNLAVNRSAPKQVVSVSLGSSRRDHQSSINLLGQTVNLSRRGVDGQFNDAIKLLQQLDGEVDAIGLGGIDIYLRSRNRVFELRDGLRLKNAVSNTPVVDGSGLKDALERQTVKSLQDNGDIELSGKKVLMVCAMDRFGMAEALHEVGAHTTYGDLIFSLSLDQPILSLEELEQQAIKLLPEICRLPISMIYPTGKQQERIEPDELTAPYFDDADVIAGDFHIMRRRLPDSLAGKGILTNTITAEDIEQLRQRGLSWLVTTTPELDGRSYGTNVLEAALLAVLGKAWEEGAPNDYVELIGAAKLKPRVIRFD